MTKTKYVPVIVLFVFAVLFGYLASLVKWTKYDHNKGGLQVLKYVLIILCILSAYMTIKLMFASQQLSYGD